MAKKRFRKKWQKWVAVGVAVVIVAGGGFAVFQISAAAKGATTTTTFTQTAVAKRTLSIAVSGSGTVSDSSEYVLTSPNAGTIDSLPVKQGDKVTAGQVIAHINDPASAQNVTDKQNALTNAQNALAQSQANLDGLNIKAPVAGKVKNILVTTGDDLSQTKSLGNPMVISTQPKMTATLNGAQGLSAGTQVTVTDNVSGASYPGTVTSASGQGATVTIGTDDPGVGDSVTVTAGSSSYPGTLSLYASVPITTASGKIASISVKENQAVAKGQTLFTLDATSVNSDIAAKKSALTAAQNQLNAAINTQNNDTITSPVNGTLSLLSVKNGATLTAGASIATIINPEAMQTVISVDELDISKVSIGQQANITLDAITGKSFTGSVIQINPIGSASNGVTNYNVTVSINNPENVMVGMTTSASIVIQSKENALVVSANAILNKRGTTGYVIDASKVTDKNGKSISLNDMTTAELIAKYGKQVTLGLSNTDQVEITQGAEQGETLAVPVTIDKKAIASLSNSRSTQNALSAFGGVTGGMTGGGFTGAGSFGGGTTTRRTTGTTGTAGAANRG